MDRKSSRRWLRFSLRTLLLVTAVITCWLGVQVNKAYKQRAAVAAIEAAGGRVYYDWHDLAVSRPNPEGPLLWRIDPRPPTHWLQRTIGEDYFQSVVHVEIRNSAVSDTGLQHLRNLEGLKGIMLFGSRDEEHPNLRASLPHVQFYANSLYSPDPDERKSLQEVIGEHHPAPR